MTQSAEKTPTFTFSITVPNKNSDGFMDLGLRTHTLSMQVEGKKDSAYLIAELNQFKEMATKNERYNSNAECTPPDDFLAFLAHTVRNETTIDDEDMFKENAIPVAVPDTSKAARILQAASMVYIYQGHPLPSAEFIGTKLTNFLNNNFEPILNGLTHQNTQTLIDIIAGTFPFRRYGTWLDKKESYSRNEGFHKLLKNTEDALGNYFSEYLSPTKELDTNTKNNFAANAAKIVNLYNSYGIDLPLPVKNVRAELLKNLAHRAFNIAANPLEYRINNILKLEQTLESNDLNLEKEDPIRYYKRGCTR